jgi:DNA-binding Lrp family transcriptional regulator
MPIRLAIVTDAGAEGLDTITEKDKALLALLKLNAREPVASLARKLGVSRTTIQDRLRRLERDRIIEGYAVKLSDKIAARGIRAFVSIEIMPRRQIEVTRRLAKFPAVEGLYAVSGRYDLIALVAIDDMEALNSLLDSVAEFDGVTGTDSFIILSTKISRR